MFKEINLTKGRVAIVDIEDYEWLSQWKWCMGKDYAIRREGNSRNPGSRLIFMHKLIMGKDRIQVDHINRDALDNRRSNLRIASSADNNRNKGPRIDNKCGYKGVSFDKNNGKWRFQIKAYNKKFSSYFDTPEEAAVAYNQKASELYGEFAYLNKVPS